MRAHLDLEALCNAIYYEARRTFPELPARGVQVDVTTSARTTPRSFAFFRFPGLDKRVRGARDVSRCKIALSPDLATDKDRAMGVVAHEIGHVVDHFVGRSEIRSRLGGTPLPTSPEQLADRIAEHVLETPLYYDDPDVGWVQTIRSSPTAVRPRPKHLG